MTGFLSQAWVRACGRRVLLVTAMAGLPCVVSATTTTLTEFTVPTASSGPTSITAGPDGNLWFTEGSGNKIGRISPTGVISEFAVPTANTPYGPSAGPLGITAGPDGNLWFAEINAFKIGQITPAGTIREFSLPTSNSPPYGIIAGPDGNLWFTEAEQTFNPVSKVGRIRVPGPVPGDVDGDGKADLVWRNTQTGDLAVWLMNGAAVRQGPVVAPGVPLTWQVAHIGDLDGDGKADLVWRNTQTGDVAVWLMNGTNVKQSSI